MGIFLKIMRSLFIYTKANSYNEFELLETDAEGDSNNGEKDESKNNIDNKDNNVNTIEQDNNVKEKNKVIKKPIEVGEWNKKKLPAIEEKLVDFKESGDIVSDDLEYNIEYIKNRFNMPKNKDIIIRRFNVAKELRSCLVFLEGMVDKNILNQFVLPQLMSSSNLDKLEGKCPIDYIEENVISINDVEKLNCLNKVTQQVLKGRTALFIEGCQMSLLIESRGYEKRSIDKPATESVVMGPQEAFTEDLRTNITLMRRNIKSEKFVTEILPLGMTSKNECAVIYLEGVASPEVIKEVKRRIAGVEIDYIQGDGMLEQLIEDNPFTLFPQILSTERPDRASSFVMEGQVVIVTEGTPFALALPVTLFRLLHTSEDYHLRWQYGTFLRLVRIIGMTTSIFLPALYAGLTLYHQEMIPTELLVSITRARESVPFPVVFELLLMEVSFELIREAGIRVPGVIGQTLGIIGALILGQAAVSAGLVSPILIIIVAVTGLGSFAIPNYSLAIGMRILRFIFIVAASIAGFYSLSAAIIIFLGLLCNLKSFGVPFLSPIAPKTKVNPDVILRQPLWKQSTRPDYINSTNIKKAGNPVRKWTKQKSGGKTNDKGR